MLVPPLLGPGAECLLDYSYRTKWEDGASSDEIILMSRVRKALVKQMVFPIYKKNNLKEKNL
jgi:hypothetical protein